MKSQMWLVICLLGGGNWQEAGGQGQPLWESYGQVWGGEYGGVIWTCERDNLAVNWYSSMPGTAATVSVDWGSGAGLWRWQVTAMGDLNATEPIPDHYGGGEWRDSESGAILEQSALLGRDGETGQALVLARLHLGPAELLGQELSWSREGDRYSLNLTITGAWLEGQPNGLPTSHQINLPELPALVGFSTTSFLLQRRRRLTS